MTKNGTLGCKTMTIMHTCLCLHRVKDFYSRHNEESEGKRSMLGSFLDNFMSDPYIYV